jgi:glutaredoxin
MIRPIYFNEFEKGGLEKVGDNVLRHPYENAEQQEQAKEWVEEKEKYNAWWCPYCRQVRAILARNHISYTILDVGTPQMKAIMLRRFGDIGVPRTVVGGVVVEGVDEEFEERIKQLCR